LMIAKPWYAKSIWYLARITDLNMTNRPKTTKDTPRSTEIPSTADKRSA
jgi:hypothetical protein